MHIVDGLDPLSINMYGTEMKFTTLYTYQGYTLMYMGDLEEKINSRGVWQWQP